ncbi:hypothetical protein GOB87_00780 [Acetobacter estunensis]|uniref:Uncharacterized protein n=1 Tax=Acetobacter estunensis TaxID=104097 RepID=A0A967BA04_9PROT|nr:hypothetical protein [Acetobacter estunensis]NHO52502.1 hypothetical protein [Acetobacter estunensis]
MIATSDILHELSADERVAVWMLRYLVGPGRPFCRMGFGSLGGMFFREDLDALGTAFRHALDRCSGAGVMPPDVRMRGCGAVSSTEMALLDATALAQKGDEKGVRATLRRLFPQRHVIASFAEAMTQLGACLASAGYWLLSRACTRTDSLSETQAIPERSVAITRRQRDMVLESDTPVAAASLATLSRWRSQDMRLAQVLWPHGATQICAVG